jgi:hypothetical protein
LDDFHCSSSPKDLETATTFVQLADKYNIPYQYEAIFFIKESTCGKHMLYNNPFGIMKKGGEKAGLVHFDSLDQAFDYEAQYLATPLYAGKDIRTMTLIYCPPRANQPYTYYLDFIGMYNQISDNTKFFNHITSNSIVQ